MESAPGASRGGRPGGAVGVRHHADALAMCLVDDGDELLVAEHRAVRAVASHGPVAGREDLDHVGAELDQLADLRPERIRAMSATGRGMPAYGTQLTNPDGVLGSYGPAEGDSWTSETSSRGPGTSPAAMASR